MLSTLRKLLNKNPLRKISETDRKVLAICIGAAFVFWLILNLSRDYSIRKTVLINYLLDPERVLVETEPVPTSQVISIEGSGWDLLWESLRWAPIEVNIDLRGKKNLEVNRSDLESQITRKLANGDLSVADLDFSRRSIYTNPKAGKRLPVVSRIKVDFAEGYVATSPLRFSPDSVTVSGSEDVLAVLESWPTADLTLDGVDQDIRQFVRLAPGRPGVTPSRESVRFTLEAEAFIQRKLEVPVTVIHAPVVDSFQVIPASVLLTVSLPQSSYHAIRPSDFTVVADLATNPNGNEKNIVPLELRRSPKATIGVMMETEAVEYYLIN
ncbi:MAG: YbbR-like domain-containing protein [Bacteroidota bacterium]